jgi:putative ABC transport system permease protein
MSFLSDLAERLKALLFGKRQEREMAEELRFHVDREAAERIKNGATPDVARREALLAFGGVEQYKEAVRDARGTRPLEELGADIRYALRGLRRNPGFTATAILVLSLGLGATTTVFSIMHAVVLAELPYPDPDRLVIVVEKNSPTNVWNISTADATAIREQQRSFEAWGEISRDQAALSGTGTPERIAVARASAGYFKAVGVPVAKGRLIEPSDEASDAPPVMIVTHALADRLLGGADRAVGRAITLDGVSHTVVGVLPPGRDELGGARAPAWPALKLRAPVRRGPFWLRGFGRLREGVTLEMATADLAAISARILPLWSDFPDSLAKLTPIPLRERFVGQARGQVGMFAGAVLLVLLLAITNVATLVLVRASARESEVAVRVMLGAGKGRIARLLVTENILLTLAAGAAGLLLASLGLKLAISQLASLPRIQDASLDWRAVGFALVAALLSGILVSLSPVMALSDRARIQADSRRAGTGRRTNAVRGGLVIAEFALALPLLVGAGLLLNSFVRLSRVDPGFDPEGLVAVGVSLPQARYPDNPEIQRFWQQAEQRLAEIPGATAFGLASDLPPDNSGNYDNFNLVDHPVPAGQSEPASPWYYVTSGYFGALGVPLLDGRLFTAADSGNGPPAVIVSRAWANKYFPKEQAVGRQLIQGGCYDCPRTTIVGVVGDIKNLGLATQDEAVYGTVTQANNRSMNLVVRTSVGSAAAFRALREAVRALDTELPLEESTIVERFDDSLADPKRWTAVLGSFAAVGMALAALGVFGLMSYVVRQRRREIGVRLALGAQPGSVTRLIITRGMRYAVVGSGIGLALTLVLTRRLGALLFGVSPKDAMTIAGVATLLLAVALAACWLPGRRAAQIRPLEAISTE